MWPTRSEAGRSLRYFVIILNFSLIFRVFFFFFLNFVKWRDWLHSVTDSDSREAKWNESNPRLTDWLTTTVADQAVGHVAEKQRQFSGEKRKKKRILPLSAQTRRLLFTRCRTRGWGAVSRREHEHVWTHTHTCRNIHMHINTFMPPRWQSAHWSCRHVCVLLRGLVPATGRSDVCVSASARLHTHS